MARHWYKSWAIKSLLLSVSLFTVNAYADDIKLGQEGTKCSQIEDRVQRLFCFDTVFKSPIETKVVQYQKSEPIRAVGPLQTMVNSLEQQREADNSNWIVRARPWHENMLLTLDDYKNLSQNNSSSQNELTPETVDIFMTMKEADVPADRPDADEAVMMLSCENDITTLAVLLPKPIETLQASLSLSLGDGNALKLNWRDVENGTIVIAGRGLESIDTIKKIANHFRVQLQVNYLDEGSRAFAFDMNDLKDKLKPLRTACHW